MKKKYIYYCILLLVTISNVACLKYKQLSNIKGLELEVQGAAPLFSYRLNVQDLFFKIAGYDSTKIQIDSTNRIYFSAQDIANVNSIISIQDSLYKTIPIGNFIGKDSVSLSTSGLGTDPSVIANGLLTVGSFVFPQKQGRMVLDNPTLNIVRLNNMIGVLNIKITNTFDFTVDVSIDFPELPSLASRSENIPALGNRVISIPINTNWISTQNNIITYNITTTITSAAPSLTIAQLNNLAVGVTRLEDTLEVERYDLVFGDIGKDRYLFKDSIRQKINIADPFITSPYNQAVFPSLRLRVDYFNNTLGLAATPKMYDAYFKMKDGSLKQILFFDKTTNAYQDTFLVPSKIMPITNPTAPSSTLNSFLLDTSNSNFLELNLDLSQVDSFVYNMSFYSPKDGLSADLSSFILQSSSTGFVNNASGILYCPYILSSTIFIDTSKTPVIQIPETFYKNIENIIKERNPYGELENISFAMTIENNTVFTVTPQVYFMNNSQIIDSFSTGQENIPAARLSVSGIVRIPVTGTITKTLTPEQWANLKNANRLVSTILFQTSKEVEYPAITSDMYVNFNLKINNINFKYLIQ